MLSGLFLKRNKLQGMHILHVYGLALFLLHVKKVWSFAKLLSSCMHPKFVGISFSQQLHNWNLVVSAIQINMLDDRGNRVVVSCLESWDFIGQSKKGKTSLFRPDRTQVRIRYA